MSCVQKAILLLLCSLPVAALHAADGPLTCINELAFPVFRKATAYNLPTEARVSVKLGSGDGQHSVTFDPPDTPVRLDLLDAFATKTRYSPACGGKTLVFLVRYLVEGEPTLFPIWEVRLRPPNEILVVTHPVKGGVN
jgi:hypothetical protein